MDNTLVTYLPADDGPMRLQDGQRNRINAAVEIQVNLKNKSSIGIYVIIINFTITLKIPIGSG